MRPYVLHPLPCRYGEGDVNAIADGTSPPAVDALGTAEQTTGQHQSRSLVHAEPVTLHELHPADHRTVGRVDLKYLHSIPVAAGDEIGLDLAVAETGQHPGILRGLAFQLGLLPLEVQPFNHDGHARLPGMLHHPGDHIPDQRLSLMAVPAVGRQRDPPSSKVVAAGVGLGHGQVAGIQVHANRAQPPVRHRGYFGHISGDEHPPSLPIPLEAVRYCLSQGGRAGRPFAVPAPALCELLVGLQGRQHLAVAVGELQAFDDHVFAMLSGQAIRHPKQQGQGAVAGNPRHAQLAAAGLVPAPQHEELAVPGIPPTGQPLLMTAVAVGLQIALSPP